VVGLAGVSPVAPNEIEFTFVVLKKDAIWRGVILTDVPDWTASSCSVPFKAMAAGRFGI
jgi:hypothetical protein